MNQNNKAGFLKLRQPENLLVAQLFLSAAGGGLFIAPILIPLFRMAGSSEADLSIEKMLFLVAIMLVMLILLASAFYFLIRPHHARMAGDFIFKDAGKRKIFLRVAAIGFAFCWVGYFSPSYLILQNLSGYLSWIKPLFSWAGLYFASMILAIRLGSDHRPADSGAVPHKVLFRAAVIAFLLFFIVFMFVMGTGLGISVQEDYWYGAGVPVLWIQISLAVLVAIVFSWLVSHVRFFKETARLDFLVFILLWMVTAYVWGQEPLQPSHFMPDTGVNALYPYSDSTLFDMGSQYALIGQGLFNGQYFDRSLYSVFLTYLHAFGGQNNETLMLLQAVVYAVFPSILYLLGRELHGRTLGISLGFVIMFRGVNSIFGASLIDLAGPKMMLTDFPTAIGISLIILFIIKWLNQPARISNIVWAGCFIGLTMLLRTHVILLLPFIIAYKIIHFKNSRTLWIRGSIFLMLGMIVSTLPLDFQNQKKGVPVFYMYYSRIQEVLEARYRTLDDPNTNLPDKRNMSSITERERLIVHRHHETGYSSKIFTVANHFLHNLAGSVLSLPASFVFDDFRHTVKESAPYWGKDWVGEGLGPDNYLLLFINLILISIGIGSIWEKRRLPGLFPLMIYFVYILSNSLALTSGGRYLTPVDWIIYVYYMLGLLEIVFWLLCQVGFDFKMSHRDLEAKSGFEIIPAISFRHIITTFAAVLMIGSVLPFTDALFPRRYPEESTKDVLLTLSEHRLLEEVNLTQDSVAEFLLTPNARLISGRLLYPRFYASGKGEPGLDYPYTALNYRRLAFMVIGPLRSAASRGVILPIEDPQPDLHASDVIVLGCDYDNFMDAAVVFVLSEPKRIYVRSTDFVLQCPLANP
jgi:hypothetical protein